MLTLSIGFGELVVILLVTLLVVGPREGAKVARKLGKLYRRMDNAMSDLRSYVDNPSSPGDNSNLVDTSEKRNDSDNANKTPAG
jgi:Sec-independent protein translocase protein TatA